MWPVLVSIFTVIVVYFYLYKPLQYWKKLKVPYITPLPVFGNMVQFIIQYETVHNCVNKLYHKYHGRALGVYFFNSPILMIKDLNLIKRIGIRDFDHFVDHRPFISEDIDPLFGKSLIALQGQRWKNMRATLSPAFTSSKMKAMFVLISDCAKQLAEHYDNLIEPNKPYELELKDTFSRFANDVIATTAFGITCNSLKDRDNEFYLMGKDATNFGGFRVFKFIGFSICKPLMHLLKVKILSDEVCDFFLNIIKSNIESREKEGIVRPDMIHLLLEARKGKLKRETYKDEDAGFATVDEFDVGEDIKRAKQELSDEDITAQAVLFFIGGFDTISTAICHMSYELAQRPDIQDRLQEEIDEALRENNSNVSYDVVMKLKYLDMVLSETLRKWPPLVVLDRVCVEPYTIEPEFPGEKRIKLQKGDVVWFPCYPIHRDPKYYPEPDKFDPERFNDENKGNIDPMSYIPFGVGPRNCIGSRFALMEAKTLFVHLLSKFDIIVTKKSEIPLRIKKGQFNPNAEKGFWVALKKRRNEEFSVHLFIHACDTNNISLIKRIIRSNEFDPNCSENNFVTGLHIAAENNYYNLAKILLELPDVNINCRNHWGYTPLHNACAKNNENVVELFIQNEADINIPNKNGTTPLHTCVLLRHNDLVEVLLKNDAKVDCENIFGKTPLYVAVIDSPNELNTDKLITYGANVDINNGKTLPILVEGALGCANIEQLEMLSFFLDFNCDVNIKDCLTGRTALHMVAITNYIPMAEILISHGADYKIKDYTNKTPMDIAIIHRNEDFILFLKYVQNSQNKSISFA